MRTRSSTMNNLMKKKFSVFEFNSDDECVEKESHKIVSKFSERFPNLQSDNCSPITKYQFLQSITNGMGTQPKESGKEPFHVDSCCDAVNEILTKSDGNSSTSLECDLIHSRHTNKTSKEILNNSEPVSLLSDDDDNSKSSSPTSPYGIGEHKGAFGSRGQKLGSGDKDTEQVVVIPDQLTFGDIFSTKSILTFYNNCIVVKGVNIFGENTFFKFEWNITDIVSIESDWCEQMKTAIMSIHVKTKNTQWIETASKSAGIGELTVTVHNLNWPLKEEAIKAMDMCYKAKWKVVFDIDVARLESASLRWDDKLGSEHCSHNLEDSFEVVFPKGDPDAISISERDIGLLQPEKFINDTIIDFYIKYLQKRMSPKKKDGLHFFNSFFFRKLADMNKNPSKACSGWEAFQRVCKWTKKVDLFAKDYIFIPINFSLHWSLIVICHLGEFESRKDGEVVELRKTPCILHMDSIKGSHRGLKSLILSYLCEEWRARHNESDDDLSSKLLDIQFVSPELPQQENSFDCGLFLLHYMECFIEQVHVNFSPCVIPKDSTKFLRKDWFPPKVASQKRAYIKKLICKIVEDDKLGCDEQTVTYSPGLNENANWTLEDVNNSVGMYHGKGFNFVVDRDIEIMKPSGIRKRSLFCGGSKLLYRELNDSTTSLSGRDYQQYGRINVHENKSVMSPIEVGEETEERSARSSKSAASGEHLNFITESPSTSGSIEHNEGTNTRHERIVSDVEESSKRNQYPVTIFCGSNIQSGLMSDDDTASASKELRGSKTRQKDERESSSTSSSVGATLVVEDSEDEIDVQEVGATLVVEDSQEETDARNAVEALVIEDSQQENNDAQDVNKSETCSSDHVGILSLSHEEVKSKERSVLRANHMAPVIEIDYRTSVKRRRLARILR